MRLLLGKRAMSLILPTAVLLCCVVATAFAALLSAEAAIAQGRSQATDDFAVSRAREEAVREKWLRVSEVFSLAGIAPGAKVADVGAGEGFLTVRLARAVGPSGRVYAVDIAPRALQVLRERAREERLDNIEVVEGAIDDPRLPRDSLDAVIILKAYHQMSAHDAMLRHIRESLKPTGRLVLVQPTSRLVAPDREAQRGAMLSAQLGRRRFAKSGLSHRRAARSVRTGPLRPLIEVADRSAPRARRSALAPTGGRPRTAACRRTRGRHTAGERRRHYEG